MPRYLICQKIRTVAGVDYADHIEGFWFRNFEADKGLLSYAWEATNEALGSDFRDAFAKSRRALLPLVDAISVVTQCAASLVATSFFVYRLEQNEDRVLYLYVARRRDPVGITLWKEEQVRDIRKLAALLSAALNFLREANNSSTGKTQLSMLIAAAESLAGQTSGTGTCKRCGFEYEKSGTDKARLRLVLGDEAYERLYVKNGGAIRHRLLHGSGAPEEEIAAVLPLAYDGIRAYLREELKLESFEQIVGAPRTFESFEHGGLFVRLRDKEIPRLRELEDHWQEFCDLIELPSNSSY